MGQNREAKKTNRMLDREYNDQRRDYTDYRNTRQGYSDEARARSDRAFDTAFSGYEDILNEPRNSAGSRYYKDFAETGGLDDENIRRIRGNGVFDEFARTGGLSDEDIANMRLQGSRVIPGFFDAVRRNVDKSANIQGYSPGYSSQTRAIARDSARGAADAALDTELGITNTRNEGRKWGASSLSGAESDLVGALQRGKMFGIEGMDRSDMASRADRLAALSGIRGLRTDTPGEVGMYEDEILSSMGQGAGNRRGLLQDRAAYNPNQSWFDKYGMPILNAGAGIASGFASGGFGRGRGRNTGVTGGRGFSLGA